MPDGSPLQHELFEFTIEEMSMCPRLLDVLTPAHVKASRLATTAVATLSSSSSTEPGASGSTSSRIGARDDSSAAAAASASAAAVNPPAEKTA